jgi:hypothetical protein
MHRSLMLCAAALVTAGFLTASPAQAAPYQIIKWPATNFCQIWDFGLPTRPIPPTYHIVSPPLPTFGAALSMKEKLWHTGVCPY